MSKLEENLMKIPVLKYTDSNNGDVLTLCSNYGTHEDDWKTAKELFDEDNTNQPLYIGLEEDSWESVGQYFALSLDQMIELKDFLIEKISYLQEEK